MYEKTNELSLALKRLLNQIDRSSLLLRPAHFYEGLIYDYSQRVLSELDVISSDSHHDNGFKETLKCYLASNWEWIKGSYLSYTALPENDITSLLCEIAVVVSDELNPPLTLLMPGVSFEPTDMVHYPDLALTYQSVEGIKQVLRTHILSQDGGSLIPVSVLYQEDILNPKPLANVYFDIFSDVHEGDSEEALRDLAVLNKEEKTRLYNHSGLTKRIGEAREQYLHVLEDKTNLLGQLTYLLKSLYFHSKNGIGQEMLSGSGIYTAAQSFYGFYNQLDESE